VSLLETLVALVILGLAGVGFLGAFQGTSRASRDAEAWVDAVAAAEAAMEQTKLGVAPTEGARVDVQPWAGSAGVELVTVTVALPGGGAFVLRRLARVP
jgi:type II secretory pathway pseudopilin PulG